MKYLFLSKVMVDFRYRAGCRFKMKRRLRAVFDVAFQVLLLCFLKILVHELDFELIGVSHLFSATVASTVFLLGFLLTGVLSDFKEAEKIPSSLAAKLESLSLEVLAIPVYQPGAQVHEHAAEIACFGSSLVRWLKDGNCSVDLMNDYAKLHQYIVHAASLFKGDVSSLRGRLMLGMDQILELVKRVKVIRDTDFVPLAYWMAYFGTALMLSGLVFAKTENLFDSVFFISIISFLVLLVLRLISDIDNPFALSDPRSVENVSLDVLEDTVSALQAKCLGRGT